MAGSKILMVEGTDDQHVVMHICGSHGIREPIAFERYGGVEQVVASIDVRLMEAREEGDIVGILVDADENLQYRWQAVRQRIVNAGYENAPEQPAADGIIIEPPVASILPRVGVWIMPDNQSAGILEDFLRFLAPAPNALLEYAEACVNGIPPEELRFRAVDEPKALMHTWLAWQETPGRPFGTAITARFLDPDVPQAAVFAAWLRNLFFADTETG